MRKLAIMLVLLILLVFILFIFQPSKNHLFPGLSPYKAPSQPKASISEKIIYSVMVGKIKIGESSLEYLEKSELNGKLVNVMSFLTKVNNFRDSELIYYEPESYLPLKIRRDIKNWLAKEQITETYDQKKFTLTITKFDGSTKNVKSINFAMPIQNAILLPFYVSSIEKLNVGWAMNVQLPNQKFLINLASIEKIDVPAGSFKAYHFTSTPKKFEIWISEDERRIPVKIRGFSAFGYTMAMKEYRQ